jgi:hypothetical protein
MDNDSIQIIYFITLGLVLSLRLQFVSEFASVALVYNGAQVFLERKA